MKILKATNDYEKWLTRYTRLIEPDIELKHQQMALAIFPFLRATFYRWIQVWPSVCKEAAKAPIVLSVGDLHVENFGTWRDTEGRLVWGVNDFDEACHLPYTNDLVRLAVSALLAIEVSALKLKGPAAVEAILAGYTEGLKSGGHPFVLAEDHASLRAMAQGVLREPVRYWEKMKRLPPAPTPIPESAITALDHALPQPGSSFQIKSRVAGLGSLGRPRYVAVTDWEGGAMAREAKALVPSGAFWAREDRSASEIFYETIVERAVRCRDPFVALRGKWIVRRLAPDCSRIELASLPEERDEARLLRAMGWETANIHLGTRSAIQEVRKDLKSRSKGWLTQAASAALGAVRSDWRDWKEAYSATAAASRKR